MQGINDLPKPTSVKGVRSFIGMANYFRNFVKGLSNHMISLTVLTKKRSTLEPFKMTREGQAAFRNIKGLLDKSSQLDIRNEEDPRTDAYKGNGQLQNRIEKLVIFVSHILLNQATRW